MREASAFTPLRLPPGQVRPEDVNRNLDEINRALRAQIREYRELFATANGSGFAKNYAKLRQRHGYDGESIMVGGRETARDGGEGQFIWRIGNIAAVGGDNDGTRIAGPAGSNGFWERQATVITPEMFGAKRDGSTLDTEALQAAFTAGANRKVYCTSGTYLHDDRLDLPSNIELYGDGRSTIFKRKDNSFTPSTVRGGCLAAIQKSKIILRDFVIDGNRSNQSWTGSNGYEAGIILMNVEPNVVPTTFANATEFVTVKDVWVHHQIGTGIICGGAQDLTFKDVVVEDCGEPSVASPSPHGLAFNEYTRRCNIYGGRYDRNHHADVVFWSNTCTYMSVRGAFVGSLDMNYHTNVMHDGYHSVEDCDLDNSGHVSINTSIPCVSTMYLNYVANVKIKNNRFRVWKSNGIGNAAGPSSPYTNLDITGNTMVMLNPTPNPDSNEGIFLSNLAGGKVNGNTITGAWDYAVVINDSTHVDVSENQLIGDRNYVPNGAAPVEAFHGLQFIKSAWCRAKGNTVRGFYWGIEEVDGHGSITNAGANACSKNNFYGNELGYCVIGRMNRGLGTVDDGSVTIVADLNARPCKPDIDPFFALPDVPRTVNAHGLFNQGDGGGGVFEWLNDTTTADDGRNNLVPTSLPRTGLWRRTGQVRGQADVASGGTITPPVGEWHKITGVTAVNFISTLAAWKGKLQEFYVTNAAGLTFNHNAGGVPANTASILTATAANVAVAQFGTFRVRYDGTNWIQV